MDRKIKIALVYPVRSVEYSKFPTLLPQGMFIAFLIQIASFVIPLSWYSMKVISSKTPYLHMPFRK
jgi:hypothetical protein